MSVDLPFMRVDTDVKVFSISLPMEWFTNFYHFDLTRNNVEANRTVRIGVSPIFPYFWYKSYHCFSPELGGYISTLGYSW